MLGELAGEQEFGFLAGGSFGGLAFGLESVEVLFVLRDHAMEAGFVERHVGEPFVVAAPGAGVGDGGPGGGGSGFDVFIVDVLFVAETEGVVFDAFDAVHAPVVLGDGNGELAFVVGGGGEVFEEAVFEVEVGEAVSFIHDVELAGEAVAAGVVAGTGFAFVGAGPGGVLGVGLVGFDLRFC